jgi:hypothetical protein
MEWWIVGGIVVLLTCSLALRYLVGRVDAMLNRRKAREALHHKPAAALLDEIDAKIAELKAKAELNAGSLDAKGYIYRRLKWWRRYRTAVVEVAEFGE